MCFRPAGPAMTMDCPECGKQVNAVLGVYPDACPFCGAKVEEPESDASLAPNAPGMPPVPGAPGMPPVPGAPGTPASPNI